jgi:hypothetical protein
MSEFINYGTIPEDNQLPIGVDEYPAGLETGTPDLVDTGTQTQVIASAPADDYGYLTNPYENLSKTQRRMLAFAAIKDAGLSLQGKQGDTFNTMVSDITARADMARKAKAEQQRLERDRLMQAQVMAMLQGVPAGAVMGGAVDEGAVPADQKIAALNNSIANLEAAAAQVAATDPNAAQALIMQRDSLLRQRDELVASTEAAEAEAALTAEQESKLRAERGSALDALDAAERALAASLGIDQSEVASAVASGEINPAKFVWSRLSLGSMLESKDWKDFNSAVTQLGSMMTFQNLATILETGAKLGVLSDSDIRLIGNISGQMDTQRAPKQTADTVLRAYKKLQETIAAIDAAELDLLMGN